MAANSSRAEQESPLKRNFSAENTSGLVEFPPQRVLNPRLSRAIEADLNILHQKLRDLQLAVSQLHREIHEREEEHNKLSLLLSRRMTILSNILLSFWTFFSRAAKSFRNRQRISGLLAFFVPESLRNSNSLGAFLLEAFMCGLQSSFPFFLSSWFLSRRQGWKRNCGFVLSTLYSLYLAIIDSFLPWTNYFSIFFNITYVICRYYFLHGLLSFHEWACFIH